MKYCKVEIQDWRLLKMTSEVMTLLQWESKGVLLETKILPADISQLPIWQILMSRWLMTLASCLTYFCNVIWTSESIIVGYSEINIQKYTRPSSIEVTLFSAELKNAFRRWPITRLKPFYLQLETHSAHRSIKKFGTLKNVDTRLNSR